MGRTKKSLLKNLFDRTAHKNKRQPALTHDPDFAEKLLSTLFSGMRLSLEDELRSEKIWRECANKKADVFKRVIEICGDADTPKARFVRAKAAACNSAATPEEIIVACEAYLRDTLYSGAFKKEQQAEHVAEFRTYLAAAYANDRIGDYIKAEENYITALEVFPNLGAYLNLADFYKNRKQLDDAMILLKGARNRRLSQEFQEGISKQLEVYENLKKGVHEHVFNGYDSLETFWGSNFKTSAYDALKKEYSPIFKEHRLLLQNMDTLIVKIKESKLGDDEINQKYIETCLADIKLYDSLKSFYTKLNKLVPIGRYEINDNNRNGYEIFKKLCVFYEELHRYEEALEICQLAIQKKIVDNGFKGGFSGRVEQLKKKAANFALK